MDWVTEAHGQEVLSRKSGNSLGGMIYIVKTLAVANEYPIGNRFS